MTTLQSGDLEKEIQRLDKIISSLLFQIDSLKEDNMALVSYIILKEPQERPAGRDNRLAEAGTSDAESDNRLPKPDTSHAEIDKGRIELSYSPAENNKGITQTWNTYSEKNIGTTPYIHSLIEKYKGRTEVDNSLVENEKGSTHPSLSHAEKDNQKIALNYVLPQTIANSSGNISSLHVKLRSTAFKISHWRTRNAAAKVLIHLYNKGDGSYRSLKNVIGYSEGGLGKLMMVMRKKGMIVGRGYQQWEPSAYALQLMKEAHLQA